MKRLTERCHESEGAGMSYIEREAAIQALGDEPEVWYERDTVEIQEQNDWDYYKRCIEAVPAADGCCDGDMFEEPEDCTCVPEENLSCDVIPPEQESACGACDETADDETK